MPTKQEKNLYDVLGVTTAASTREIKQAYRRLALETHPDKNPDDVKEATVRFNELKRVYQTLVDEEKRKLYDETGIVFGDDDLGDDELSASQLFERLNAMRKPLTAEDIIQYEKEYRNGDEEKEDLFAFYIRFEGKVDLVLQYIPFSEEADLERFVEIWDQALQQERISQQDSYGSTRRRLLRRVQTLKKEAEKRTAKNKTRNGDKTKSETESMDALMKAMSNRGKERLDNLTASLEKKYGPNGGIAKKRK